MHTRALTLHQTVGASLTILGGVLYGKARQAIEQEAGPIPLVFRDVSMGLPTSRGVDAGGGEEVPPTEGKGRWAF